MCTVMKNGSTTALTTTISDTNTSNADTSNTVSFSAGDTISLQTVPSGTPTAPGDVAWSIRQDATNLFGVIGGMQDNLTNNAVSYQGLMAQIFSSTTESAVYGPVASAGVFKNLYVKLSGSPGSGKSYAFALMVNGSPSALTTTISDAATTGNDTTHTVSVAAGDIVSMRVTPSGTPTAVRPSFSMSFDPTTDGESFIIWSEPGGASTSAVRYDQPHGRGANAWSASETSQWIRIQQATITGLFFKMNGVSGASKTWTLMLRKELADTTATVAISGASDTAGSITGLSIAASDDDRIGYMLTPTNTPNNNSHKGGIQLYVAPPTTTTYSSTLTMMGVG